MLLLVLQLIFFVFLLVVIGEPLRVGFFHSLKLFSGLDFIQICIFDVYLGGFILYVIAMLPFRLFSWTVVFLFTVFSFLFSFFIHFKTLSRVTRLSEIRVFLTENKKAFLDCILVFAMFFIFFLINFIPLSDFVFGSVHDESIHSLKVQVILENDCVPVTLQPYSLEGNIYPLASHVIFAFASYMLNMEVPKTVFYVTILFKSLSVFGAYFLGKKLSDCRIFYLGLSFVFVFVSGWPLYITWGANPFIVGFPLFLISLGLLFSLLRSNMEISFVELITVGLLFGYAGAIVISFLQTLIMIATFVFLYWFVVKSNRIHRNLLDFIVIFLISLLPFSPFLVFFFAFHHYPGHNIGIPSDFSGYQPPQLHVTQALQWAFENLSPYLLLRLIIILILIGYVILVWRTKNHKHMKPVSAFALTVFIAAALLSFISFALPKDFGVVSWGHQGIIMMVPINIVIITFYKKFADFIGERKLKWLRKIFLKNFCSTPLLIITFFSLMTAPFLYYRFLVDPGNLRNAYDLFAVGTQNDYDLMIWMKENLSSPDAVILVNQFEAGLFIPSVSHHRIIFPYSGSMLSSSYQALTRLLRSNVINATTYELLEYWNISHIFVGSRATQWWLGDFKWNPKLFLGNPNFQLKKKIGEAYLFEFVYTSPNIVFYDDFEHVLWNENGWVCDLVGNGLGNATVTTIGYNGPRFLKITAQAMPTVWEWKFAYIVRREIFVLNNSKVAFSLYFNATEGFHGKDTFAILISNIYRNQSMVITTPDGIYENYKYAISLEGFEGLLENFDLSTKWQQMFNSSLPNPFILEFVSYDFDGVKNVVYIDNIKVTSSLGD